MKSAHFGHFGQWSCYRVGCVGSWKTAHFWASGSTLKGGAMEGKLGSRAKVYVDLLLDQYRKKALSILRDYQAQKSYIEWALDDVTMAERHEYGQELARLRDGQLLQLRKDAQRTLGEVRLKIASLGGDCGNDNILDLKEFGKREVERARGVVERLKDSGGDTK